MPNHVHLLIYPYQSKYNISIDYIEANPVVAGLVENPEDWKWSSARARRYNEVLVPDESDIPFLMN